MFCRRVFKVIKLGFETYSGDPNTCQLVKCFCVQNSDALATAKTTLAYCKQKIFIDFKNMPVKGQKLGYFMHFIVTACFKQFRGYFLTKYYLIELWDSKYPCPRLDFITVNIKFGPKWVRYVRVFLAVPNALTIWILVWNY